MSLLSSNWMRNLFRRQTSHYQLGVVDDELEPLENKDPETCQSDITYRRDNDEYITIHKRSLIGIFLANLILFLISSSMLIMLNHSGMSKCRERDISAYSPIFDRLKIKRSPKHFNFTFWPEDPPSIWQLPPSPEVDAVWKKVTLPLSVPITGEEVRLGGHDPAAAWPFAKEDAGEDAYFGLVSFVHQAHCLNLFRKAAFPAYFGDMREKQKGSMFPFDDHLLHCQNILMEHILCHADVEVTVFHKYKGFRGPDASFDVTRNCRNYQDILDWKEMHQIQPKGPFIEYPDTPIIELDPEFVLTPQGSHECRTGHEETDGHQHCQTK